MGCLTRVLWVVALAFLVFVAIVAWFVSIVAGSTFSPLVIPWLAVALGTTWLAFRLARKLWHRPLPGAITAAIAQLPAGKKVRRSQAARVDRPTDEEFDSATDYGRASAILREYMHSTQGERHFEADRAVFETAGYELAAVARTENRPPGEQAAVSAAARILSYGASGEPDIGRIYALYKQRPGLVPARPIPTLYSWRKPGRWRLAYAVPWLAIAVLFSLTFGGVMTPQDSVYSILGVLLPALFPAVGFLLIRPKGGLFLVALLGLPIAVWLFVALVVLSLSDYGVAVGQVAGWGLIFILPLAALLASLIAIVVLPTPKWFWDVWDSF